MHAEMLVYGMIWGNAGSTFGVPSCDGNETLIEFSGKTLIDVS